LAEAIYPVTTSTSPHAPALRTTKAQSMAGDERPGKPQRRYDLCAEEGVEIAQAAGSRTILAVLDNYLSYNNLFGY